MKNKNIEIIRINQGSGLNQFISKYNKRVLVIFVFLFILIFSIGIYLHYYFIKKEKLTINNIPHVLIFLMVIIVISFFFAFYHFMKNLKNFKNYSIKSESEYNSIITSIDLLILSIKPIISALNEKIISKEIKETIFIHKSFLDYILETKEDYSLFLSFTRYFIDLQLVILNYLTEQNSINENKTTFTRDKISEIFDRNFILEILPLWKEMIEEKMHSELSKLSLGIESLQKMENQFNTEINEIEQKLTRLDNVVKNITEDNTKNIEVFFNSFKKQNEKVYNDYQLLKNKFSSISKILLTIDELSKDISIIAFNIEIEASKSKESKAFSVLAKEVRNFSNQLNEYYSSINETIEEINNFLVKSNYNEEYIEENILSHLNKIKELFDEYDKSFIEIRALNQKLIAQNKENQKIFLKDVDDNLKVLQNLSIKLEQLDHRNRTFEFILNKYNNNISDIMKNNDWENKDIEIKNIKQLLEFIKSIITGKEEFEFVKKLFKEYLNENIEENEPIIKNKYKGSSEKDEGIIIF